MNLTLKELEHLIITYSLTIVYWITESTEIGQEEGLVTDKVKQDCYGGEDFWSIHLY